MKNRFDTFKAAGWLLDESYDPMNYMTEAEETEETVAEEDEEEEDLDSEDNDEDLELDDDAGDEDLDLDDDTEDEEEDSVLDPDGIAGRLDAIEAKLDDIADKNEPDEDETFDLDLANPVCPCCGARLNILNTVADTEEIAAEGGDEDEDEENSEDEDISALLAGETPEEDVEAEGEDITAMDDSLDDVDGLGYDDNEYVSLDDEDEDED